MDYVWHDPTGEERAAAFERQDGRCHDCNEPFEPIPVDGVGREADDSVYLICQSCDDKLAEEVGRDAAWMAFKEDRWRKEQQLLEGD